MKSEKVIKSKYKNKKHFVQKFIFSILILESGSVEALHKSESKGETFAKINKMSAQVINKHSFSEVFIRIDSKYAF